MTQQTVPCMTVPYSGNVVPFRLGILPRHREYLMRWLEAGLCMGLCDADVFPPDADDFGADASYGSPIDYVVVWVRESSDPAYIIRPAAASWVVIDNIRDTRLGQFRNFEDALNFIRPVLPTSGKTVAA